MKTLKNIMLTGILTSCVTFASVSWAANYMEDAEKFFEKGEYKAAIIQLKNQLKENPEDFSARFLLGKSYLETGDVVQADKEISRAYQLNSSNEEFVITYAQLLLLQRKFKRVHEILDKKFSDPEKENQRLIYIAYAYLGENQLADAKQIFSGMENQNQNIQVLNGLVKIAILEKEMDLAEQLLDSSLKIEPENVDTLKVKAIIEIINKKYDQALIIYNKLIQMQENNLSLYLKRAEIKIQLNDYQNAEKDVQKVLDKVKNYPQANYMLAQLKLHEGEYKDAEMAAQNVLNILPRHFNSMLILGVSNFAQGNYNQADKYLTQYLSANPDNLKIQNMLANVYLAQNKAEQALLILENIDEEKRNHTAEILMTMGSAYLLNGEHQKGIDALNKAKEMAPNNELIKKRLIDAQLKTGDIDSAISNLEKIADSEKTHQRANYLLVISYIQKKELKKAEDKLQELIQKTPNEPALYNLSAIVEKLKGDNETARKAYNQAIKLNDKFISAYVGLAELAILKEDWGSAKAYFLKVAEIDPKYIKVYIYLATVAEKQNDPNEMERQLKKGMIQAKGNVKSLVTLASLLSKFYLQQKSPEKIMSMALEINRNHPKDKAALSFLAAAQIVNKKKEEAMQTLTTIINNDVSDVKHRLMLANLLSEKKENKEQVLELIDAVISISPNDTKPVVLKAVFLLKNKDYQAAREVAEYAKKQFPGLALGYQLEGDTYRMELKLDKALKSFQEGYNIQPNNKLLFIIAAIQTGQGKEIEALKTLEDGLKNNDQDLQIHLTIAEIYQNRQQSDMAKKHYLQMLEIEADNVVALNNLAWIFAQEKNPQALTYAQNAYEKAPKSAAIIDTYGYILIKNGNFNEGIQLLREAISLAPEAYDIQYHLAEGYYLNGETKKAKVMLNSLLNKKIEFSEKDNAKNLYSRLK